MAGISKAERERRAALAEADKQSPTISDDGDSGDAQPDGQNQIGDKQGTAKPQTNGAQQEDGEIAGGDSETAQQQNDGAQPDGPELVSMVRDEGQEPSAADVHPAEVENYQRGGWRIA